MLKKLCCFQKKRLSPQTKLSHWWLCVPSRDLHIQVNNGNSRTVCEICSKLTIKTPERHQRSSGVFIANLDKISRIVLVYPWLTWTSKCQLNLIIDNAGKFQLQTTQWHRNCSSKSKLHVTFWKIVYSPRSWRKRNRWHQSENKSKYPAGI